MSAIIVCSLWRSSVRETRAAVAANTTLKKA
jgi:hypothetical protein